MNVSTLIPAYNCEGTIRATLDSVLHQTLTPLEIIVLDDGSTDHTSAILSSYQPRITVIPGKHEGAAGARNALCAHARGDLLTFLDSDDLWHPKYLETRCRAFERHPEAVAFFSGHVNFTGREANHEWDTDPTAAASTTELISARDFLRRYNQATGVFGSMSYCSVPKSVFNRIGAEPFKTNPTEDSYLMYQLALLGPIFYDSMPLVAYRIIPESVSANRLRSFGSWVSALELMESRYNESSDADLRKEFKLAFGAKRRAYARILMGAGKTKEARDQLRRSIGSCDDPSSFAKSFVWLCSTWLPRVLQPAWPPSHRVWSDDKESPTLAANRARQK
jgi:glycosyltransferase involved in cell wall biosynthesis